MTKKDENLFTAIVVLASIPFSIVLRGWVLSVAWEWFCVPLGAPVIGKAHAIGIAIMVAMLTTHAKKERKEDDKSSLLFKGALPFVESLFFLFAAWIAHAVMVG